MVIFENVIAGITSLMRWTIPDVPQQLRQQIRQHTYLTNELILQQEFNRAKELSNKFDLQQSQLSKLSNMDAVTLIANEDRVDSADNQQSTSINIVEPIGSDSRPKSTDTLLNDQLRLNKENEIKTNNLNLNNQSFGKVTTDNLNDSINYLLRLNSTNSTSRERLINKDDDEDDEDEDEDEDDEDEDDEDNDNDK